MELNGRPVCSDGLAPPIEEWQKAINDQLEKIRKLEETYDNELIIKKVITTICMTDLLCFHYRLSTAFTTLLTL